MTGSIIGAGVLGAGASYLAADSAADAQNAATAAASQSADDQLAFQQQQYQDWKDVYGDTQDNLAEFYNNYDAEYVTALGLQNIDKEYSASKEALTKEMAQRGMDTSGLTAAGLTQLEAGRASESANVRAQAPLQAAQAQQSFLGMGLGLESSLQQGISGAYQNQQNIYGQSASSYGQQAAAASSGVGQSISSIGTGFSTYSLLNAMQAPVSTSTAATTIQATPAPTIQATPAPTYIPPTSTVVV